MKYCQRCILPEDYPGAELNDEAICSRCTGQKPDNDHNCLGKERLVALLDSQQGYLTGSQAELAAAFLNAADASKNVDFTEICVTIYEQTRHRWLAQKAKSIAEHLLED